MALFKINRGSKKNLPETKTEGYMYITDDIGDIYVDISPTERIRLNAESAEKLRKITYNDDGSKKSEVFVDYDYISTLNAEKMDKENPIGTGSFSMNRKAGTTIGDHSHAEGYQTTASGTVSHAEGLQTIASGINSHAEGDATTASGDDSHAEGNNTTAEGLISHAEGSGTWASGMMSHAEGYTTIASGDYSHAEGMETEASNQWSHAEGCRTLASGPRSHAEGYTTVALGDASHTEGDSTFAIGCMAHTEGEGRVASGGSSHAEGGGYYFTIYLTGEKNTNTYTYITDGIYDPIKGAAIKYKNQIYYIIDINGLSLTLNQTISPTRSIYEAMAYCYYTGAFGTASHAEGMETIASGDYSHAEGNNTTAFGEGSHAEGEYTTVTNDNTISPQITIATNAGYYGHAEGYGTISYGTASHAEGNGTTASGKWSHAEGFVTEALGMSSHTEGNGTIASGECSHAEGNMTKATKNSSHSEGGLSNASGAHSHAEGFKTIASGSCSHAEGSETTASGEGSHTEGNETVASGNHSHAEGYGHPVLLHLTGSANSTTYKVTQGSDLCRVGVYVVWGITYAKIVDIGLIPNTLTITITLDTTLNPEQDFEDTEVYIYRNGAYGEASHAEGYGAAALGKASHAEGYDTTAYNDYSHAEGYSTMAEGDYSHAEGYSTMAEGDYSHAEGSDTYAQGNYSHAEGDNTAAWGTASHAEGAGATTAYGDYSHAEGYGVAASGWGQHVQGTWNINDAEGINVHIVGNGWDKDTRSNAHTLDWDGNAWFAGDVYVHSTSGTNKDEGSKKLATEEYVTNILGNAGGAFYAAYGTTTNAEIKAAYDAGKTVLCAYETRIYRLYRIPTGSNTIYFTSEYDYDGENDRLHYLSVSTSNEWSNTYATDSSFSSAKYYNGSTEVVSTTGYYRPIRVSTAEPTASDGNVGDIWIQYSL